MLTLDCLGEMCPVPLLRLQKALGESAARDGILLITDHSCVPKSIEAFCATKKLRYVPDEVINGVWELHIALPEEG